jgi:hypothetical protein
MLRTLKDLKQMRLDAIDGPIGSIRDAYFDDQSRTLRYLVVDTGGWLSREVLITPTVMQHLDWANRRIDVRMTREQVENSPAIDSDRPFSQQHEMAYMNYLGLPHYWSGPMLWGQAATPFGVGEVRSDPLRTGNALERDVTNHNEAYLRSCEAVSGYHIEADDGAIGHIDDYLFADATWTIQYLILDTRKWLAGKRVVISTEWVEQVSWKEHKACIAMSRQNLRDAPEYDRDLVVRETTEFGHASFATAPTVTPSEGHRH